MPSPEALEPLSYDDRRILQVLSVVYETVTQTQLLEILRRLGWRGGDDKLLGARLNTAWRESMIAARVLANKAGLLVAPDLVEILTRETVRDGTFKAIMDAAEAVILSKPRHAWEIVTVERHTRRLRNALYAGREVEVLQLLGLDGWSGIEPIDAKKVDPLVRICTNPFDPDWLETQAPRLRVLALAPRLDSLAHHLSADDALDAAAQRLLVPVVDSQPLALAILVEQHLWRGRFDQAAALLSSQVSTLVLPLIGWLHAVQGRRDESLGVFELYFKTLKRETRRRNIPLGELPGVLHLLLLLARGRPEDLTLFNQQIQVEQRQAGDDRFEAMLRLIEDLGKVLQGTLQFGDALSLQIARLPNRPFNQLFLCLVLHWLGERPNDKSLVALDKHVRKALAGGWLWYAWEAHALLDRLGRPMKNVDLPPPPEGSPRLADLIKSRSRWEIALDALTGVGAGRSSAESPADSAADRRMCWWLHEHAGSMRLEPREQKRAKRGGWTSGRPVSLQRLRESPAEFDYLTPADERIRARIKRDYESGWYGGGASYSLDSDEALLAAVGHPLIFRPTNLDTPLEVVEAGPALEVSERAGEIRVRLQPFPPVDGNLLLVPEGKQRLRVVHFDATHRRIATILAHDGLRVPAEGKERVLAGIAAVAPLLTVHSAIGGTEHLAEPVEPDTRPYVHLNPVGDGLNLELYMQPLGESGPRLAPGQGMETIFAELDGRAVQTTRSLKGEKARAKAVLDACPSLAGQSDWAWMLPEAEEALTALSELYALGDDIVLQWPEGKRIGLTPEAGIRAMTVRVGEGRDWLGLEGGLTLDDGRVLEMKFLLDLLDVSPGRFVSLGEREFLVLSESLRRRLETLRGLTDGGHFHPLAAGAVDEALEGMQVEAGARWREMLQRLSSAREFEPTLPSTLQAELRDYQIEGFRWLARLAHLGAGACLADDMGLGKTLQSLALILSRTTEGPTLVLAPMSVCSNWVNEARRFAPTLNPKRFGDGDRDQMLKDAGPFDLIVCSYGLVQTEGERLAGVTWSTIVADEAQTFKNPQTKRSQAIMKLDAGFKMITTGTPIENHLGELWNLFRFINPGLLGSLDRFNQRFAVPIEQHRDSGARTRLRQLLKPFILRRLKSEVLTELPPRTEITLELELGKAEAALYEAMRRQALERLESEETAGPGQKRIQLLAEIMRLRRACCHPKLVMPETDLGSAKLEAFGEILDDLLENRHKALVFSQFVDHLSLIRAYLDGRGIKYQYLDGSTSETKRKAAVAAFQAGEGDLFLISLRAGGAGLNLTAADYVIHMDPWWNPAVEDQASDRAHRIGQERPVTIYRLVTKGTIEEKIIALHGAKRDLADGLLEGTGDGGRLSYDEILGLIREVD
jgi:hypothetical protein